LEPLQALTDPNRKNITPARLTLRSKLIKSIISSIQEKKGENIAVLDLRKINEAVCDFFVICEASNQPQIRAIADNIREQVRDQTGDQPYHFEGYDTLQWVLLDYVNVVVHVMLTDSRKFYQLEEMWSDAPVTTY